ncbi:Golgi transport complex subunit 6 [Pleurotus pulmonarius]|nr:Golgi transport complex subunit 6 [Pleurotus pulmonarius]KAF4579178.1 Golgi transport complex subunit 6 [Pleurotus pulmonarius]KAF4603482.1 Golgi transport complex subunit 6 [Pleurotus pulmonarius]
MSTPSLTVRPTIRPSVSHSSQRNPISARLYKLLGTSFDDNATREALQTLSELYATQSTSSKGKDIVHDTSDDHDSQVYDAELEVLSASRANTSHMLVEAIPGETAATARRQLKRDMENKLAEGSHEFLNALGEVSQRLQALQVHIDILHTSCDEAEAQLEITKDSSKALLEHAGNVANEKEQVEKKISIVNLFLGKFTLTEEEVKSLTSKDVHIGKAFFEAMDKTERIRDDCMILMSGEEGPTKVGLDIISNTSTHLEAAYEKIVSWCSYEFQQMGREPQLEVGTTMRESVRRLRKRPELLNEALGQLSETRQTALLSSFLAALTRGGPSGLPRPIELHAHDPIRYVGDMLAWVHQAIAAEREFLESLFDLRGHRRMVGSVRDFTTMSEEEEWIRELMDLAVAKLCVPLKVRVQQTIRSQESSIMSFKIANLLQFYMLTMVRTIGEGALLSKTLNEITDAAYKVFYTAIESQASALSREHMNFDDASLTPPLSILDHAQILREIMNVYQSSLIGNEADEEEKAGFERIADVMIDPAVETCVKAGKEKQRLRPSWDQPIFVLNCLTHLQSVLEACSFTMKKQAWLQAIIDDHVSQLTEEHYHNLLADAGLETVIQVCQTKSATEPLSRLPAAEPAMLQKALQHFSVWLSGLEVVQSPRLTQLTVQRLHSQIHHAALQRLLEAYQLLCDEVKKPSNRYEAAATLLGSERPFGQINILRQIFGLEG